MAANQRYNITLLLLLPDDKVKLEIEKVLDEIRRIEQEQYCVEF